MRPCARIRHVKRRAHADAVRARREVAAGESRVVDPVAGIPEKAGFRHRNLRRHQHISHTGGIGDIRDGIAVGLRDETVRERRTE